MAAGALPETRGIAGSLPAVPLQGAAPGPEGGQAPAGRAEDLVQGNGHLVLRPVFGYLYSGSIRSHSADSEEDPDAPDQAPERNPRLPAEPHPGQGYAPSFEEIAEQFGFQSLATVHEHLTNLERKGYIRRSYNESRSIEVLPPRGTSAASEIPLLGKVAAGTPIESLMHQETIAVPDQMLPRRGPNYALKVQGTSMIDEHIVDGDIVVVHGKQTAENGEMVIALVNGSEATVKKFYREPGGWIRLQPANATMQPMRFQERDVLIQGVVVGVIRKY